MQSEIEERWRQLCKQAIIEHDPDKFMSIILELNDVLERQTTRKPPADAPMPDIYRARIRGSL